jgi:hypothetical protein
MVSFECQEEDDPKSILFFKPMRCLGEIRPYRRDEGWSSSLYQTFFTTSIDSQIPVIVEKSLFTCGCKKFQLDVLGDHLCTCTRYSGANRVGWIPRERGGSGVFGSGPTYHT